MITVHDDAVIFRDDKDWLEVIVFVVFLVVFPMAILAMWRAPRETIPLWFAVPFTALFALCVPFMVRRVTAARTRTLSVNRRTGDITIVARRPFQREVMTVPPNAVEKAIFNTTDNDGEWYTAYLRIGVRDIAFAQGSVHADVYGRFRRMVEELEPFHPGLAFEETRD